MRHLHFHFIAASLSVGLGILMLLIVVWQAFLLTLPGMRLLPMLWIQAVVLLAGGSTLLAYGWFEVRKEMLIKY